MNWFGKPRGLKYECECQHVATPVGQDCGWCDELIEADDEGLISDGEPIPYHYECFMRQIVGGIFHQTRECYCCGGNKHPDPDGVSKREAAKLALDMHSAMTYSKRGSQVI